MEEAKEVHKCLRTAAGIFTTIKVCPKIVYLCAYCNKFDASVNGK